MYEERTDAPQRGYVLRPAPPWRTIDEDGRDVARPPTVCPLYLGRVAEASDVFEALPHFRRGTLDAWLGRAPDRHLLDCLEAYDHGQRTWDCDPNGGARKAGA